MTWNWQQEGWPTFTYEREALAQNETRFLHEAGIVHGAIKHLTGENKTRLTIDLISNEAVTTSEIEGEILNRDSVQSSMRRNFGLDTDNRKISPAEHGIAAMMTDLYRHYDTPLADTQLFAWHEMLAQGRKDLKCIGAYRAGADPMQVVSGPIGTPKVHFEAPPAKTTTAEMHRFINLVQPHLAKRTSTAPRFDTGRDRAPALCLRSSIRRRQRTDCAGTGGKGSLPRPKSSDADRTLAHNLHPSKSLLQGARRQQQEPRNHRLAHVLRAHGIGRTTLHATLDRLPYRENQTLRPPAGPTQSSTRESARTHVSRRA